MSKPQPTAGGSEQDEDGPNHDADPNDPLANSTLYEEKPPEVLLEEHNGKVLWAAITRIQSIEVLQEYVAYENQRDEPRTHVLRQLAKRADQLRADTDTTDS